VLDLLGEDTGERSKLVREFGDVELSGIGEKALTMGEVIDYAEAYSTMKPKQAAGIFEAMDDNLNLAARILNMMEPAKRGEILGVMDPEVAAKLTKIMNPES